jgi:hypothetical protein
MEIIRKNTSGNFVGGAAVTYTQFLTQNAYVNVHLSTGAMVTIVAQGNIGSNVSSVESKRMQSLILEPQLMYLWRGITDECSNLTYLKRGGTYTFNVSTWTSFYINTVQGLGTANKYTVGITNNGAVSGVITFTVQ